MKNLVLLLAVLFLVLAVSGCGSDSKSDTNSAIPAAVSEENVKTSEEIKTEIVGQWGRIDEVMHYFTENKTCIIGGMQGTYDIGDDKSLVLTTMSGSVTVYDWASSRGKTKSEHYWYLDGDVMKIDGNEFTKIYGHETPDYVR